MFLAMIDEYDKGVVMQISTLLGHVYHIAFGRSCEIALFRHLSDYVFGVGNFENTKPLTVMLLFKDFKI